jgi:hypothetical protein
MLVKHYPFYSYEAIPLTKLLNFVGMDVYVLNFMRPPKFVSYLAESPYLIRGICFLMLGTLSIGILLMKIRRK